ncbi:MAG: helix-turn-helix domain-containing protein [Dysgonomonas sp.]
MKQIFFNKNHPLSTIIDLFWNAFSIPIQIYKDSELIAVWGHSYFQPDPAFFLLQPYLKQDHSISFVVSPDHLMAGLIRMKDTDEIMIIGLMSPYQITYSQVEQLRSSMNLSPSRSKELQMSLHHMPTTTLGNFRDILIFLYKLLCPSDTVEPVHLSYKANLYFNTLVDVDFEPYIHDEIDFERRILQAVELGMPEKIKTIISEIEKKQLRIAILADNTIRSMKNTTIGSVYLISRAAIKGGLSYNMALSLSDFYITKIEKLSTYAEINDLFLVLAMDYATRTKKIELKPSSIMMQRMLGWISDHLYQKITISDMAEKLNISTSYLSHQFKKEYGISLHEYISNRKIEEALFLLETTTSTIPEISELLAYSSQQHFTTAFKIRTGKTPGSYRNIL